MANTHDIISGSAPEADAKELAYQKWVRETIYHMGIDDVLAAIEDCWMRENIGPDWNKVNLRTVANFDELSPRLRVLKDGLKKVKAAFSEPVKSEYVK